MISSNLIIYNDGELELNVSLEQETVWLNRNQISLLLGRDVKTIGKHINNVFKDGELDKSLTIANFATVQNEDGREVKRDNEIYHMGASLKDLGKKWFAFSKFDMGAFEMLGRLK